MRQTGIVISVKRDIAEVRLEKHSGCSGCEREKGCLVCSKPIILYAYNRANAKIGDTVELLSPDGQRHTLPYAAAIFLIPVLCAAVACVMLSGVTQNEGVLFAVTAAVFTAVFGIVSLFLKRFADKHKIIVEKIKS